MGGTDAVAGCPDNIRVLSGAGPFAVIIFGVWQSPHPPYSTRYLPRASSFLAASLVCANATCVNADAIAAHAAIPNIE
jgi:hypothetical protein